MAPQEEAMTRQRHTEEHIIAVLKDAQAGIGVQEFSRKHGISDATFYEWRAKYAGLEVSDVKKLRQLEDENRRLKQIVAEQALDFQALKAVTAKTSRAQGKPDGGHVPGGTLWAASATGLSVNGAGSEPPAVLQSTQDDVVLWTPIREIAESKRRYGCPRIYVRLRREGWRVNHKKVERLYYRDEALSLRRRRRKNAAAVPRVALTRPSRPGLC
jgi:putative transposase